ncbi:carbohydrate ABC transporter permease [Bradyrhizobium sp. JYMT SZCCT0428]|uniref:carbohydrate ABC transporter permease n=1 Tax=Bradyrhizobium sp. JYMT SZCCT0428 TaxID=2807673 RepID=UPI001BA46874|nr:carbohydrate ABC transporter permease [Bradyrhizobium sp. JYMT SZCCT0428]MBR1149429.1 carbohydrate ABC transporter permease [Bradyrhizobium sp. JYMT SZCCT0428]
MSQINWKQPALFVLLLAFTVVNLLPIIWAAMISVKNPVDAFMTTLSFNFEPTFEYHLKVWRDSEFLRSFFNSIAVSVSTVLISVSCGTMAAYQLTRMPPGRSRVILLSILGMRMFPHILLALPFFVIAQLFNLIDTYFLLVLAFVAINQPFTIWFMRSFFADVPREIYEAAAIDGCNAWQTFYRVALPIVRPGLWVTSLFSLLLAYNEFLFARVLTGAKTKTLPVAISSFGTEDVSYWPLAAAAAIGITLPIILFMVLLQRHLVRGIAMGAVKG